MSVARQRRLPWFILGLIMVAAVLTSCRHQRRGEDERVFVVSAKLASAWVRNFNPFSPNALWPTRAGVYEPLMIFNTLSGDYVPWLATEYRWGSDGRTLEFTLRSGVKWSDGRPMTAEDVVYTFELMRSSKALDGAAVWTRLTSVERVGPSRVRFTLARRDYPMLGLLAHQMIVPKHIWSKVKDPLRSVNADPVATGPYTEVVTFRTQLFELGLNPHYWGAKPGMPQRLRLPAYASNDTVSLALVSGEIDWAGHNVPLIDRTYVARDPEHFGYWFPPYGGMVFLYANVLKAPFHRPQVRRALSQAIDRERLVRIGMSGYTRPADGSGLSPTYDRWRCCREEAAEPTRFDRKAAVAGLKAAGCREVKEGWRCPGLSPQECARAGRRDCPAEVPLAFTLEVVSGWSDWIRCAQLLRQDLQAIGARVQVKTLDFGAWFDRVQTGSFEVSLGWSTEGITPYETFRQLAASATRRPLGEASPGNWHRYSGAVFDEALTAMESTAPGEAQKQLVARMEREFIRELPAIPLFPNPSWGTYSTRLFEGFPNAKRPFAKLTPHAEPERLLVLTSVRVRGGGR